MRVYKLLLLLVFISISLSEKKSLEIQKEINSTNKNLASIKEEISNVENEINKIIHEEKNNEKIIKAINKKIDLIEKEIELLRIQEKNINNKINSIKKNIINKEIELENRKIQIKKRVNFLYKKGNNNLLSKVISSKNWNSRLTTINYYKIILKQELKIKNEIKIFIKNLNIEKKDLKKEIENKKIGIENKKYDYKKLKKEKNRKNEYIKKISDDKKKLNDILNIKKTMMAKIETSIKKLLKDKKAAKKIEDELAKKRSKQNKSTSGNFAIMKGKLDWPISGKVVSKFGFHTNPKLNTKIENLGIDIKTDKNEKIYPVLDGVVSIITYNREYGNMIIVSHGGGYHTVYANVENIMVNENDYIESNTKIGEVSKSSISNEHLLHFQIWKNESKLNPEDWLK